MLELREKYVAAIEKEAKERVKEQPSTLYIGGGTPSTLSVEQVGKILRAVTPDIEAVEEVTMEANPGDLGEEYLREIRKLGIKRLSIGVQSLDDTLLQRIGRRHTAAEAKEAVRRAQEAGIENISVDLMYGLPGQTMEQWEADIEAALRLGIQHLSTYCLSYEQGTALTRMRDKGEVAEQDEDTLNAMYDRLCHRLTEAGFEHYEVSNFAKPGFRSRHNSRYWDHTPYIGLGAAAHSLEGRRREWNPADLEAYIRGIQEGTLKREGERLSDEEWHEEEVMLGLRTAEGIEATILSADARRRAEEYIERGLMTYNTTRTRIRATREGIHILNTIITDLL